MSRTPILQDLTLGDEDDDNVDVISDVAAELLADTIDSIIELSNSLAKLIIFEEDDGRPCICTKYVVCVGEGRKVHAVCLGYHCPWLYSASCV